MRRDPDTPGIVKDLVSNKRFTEDLIVPVGKIQVPLFFRFPFLRHPI